MRHPLLLIAPLVAVAALAIGGGFQASAQDVPLPTTQQVLLGAPDPAGPTTRGVFLNDPEGQVQQIAAVGHLVAWTVRTPADTLTFDRDRPKPEILPTLTQVIVVDERGGAPLTVDFPGRWVQGLQAFRGPAGPTDPQLAVRSCLTRKPASCTVEVLALTPDAPLALRSRSHDQFSPAAYAGRIDSGRRLIVGRRAGKGKHKACLPRLSVRTLGTEADRRLPALPAHDSMYRRCIGISAPFMHGRYAFASVYLEDPKYSISAEFFYGIDLDGGPRAKWRLLQIPGHFSDGSASWGVGPAVTDSALYWEYFETDETGAALSLTRAVLPADVEPPKQSKVIQRTSDPVQPDGKNSCSIAATDDAIYELANPRCAQNWPSTKLGGEIRRLVNPDFRSANAG